MKTITTISLTTLLVGLTLSAQETQRPRAGGLAERFRQLDRNGDGKLSAEEAAAMPSLARLLPVADSDGDGALSHDEIREASARWPPLAQLIGEKPAGRTTPTATAPSSTARRTQIPSNNAPIDPQWGPDVEPRKTTLRFAFVPDFLPGTKDANGGVLGGTELMRLTTHDGILFAGVGYFGQDPAKRPAPGAQVLRKDSASSGWVVDATFPVRKLDGICAHGEIYPEGGLPSGRSLQGVRSIIESSFAEERGQVWYFAGHGAERKLLHNAAWIYKGTLDAKGP
jgi:hypothetical protein